MPTHFRLRSEEAKCLVGGEEKSMSEFRACFGREVICLFVEIMVRLRADDIRCVHRVSVFFIRSSS